MAGRHASSAADVAEAMAMSFEREDSAGAPWCPANDAGVLRRWVTDRSRPLGGGIRRTVRLARLARLADGHDYLRFIYVRLPSLRTRHFRELLQRAAAEGRLGPAVAEITENAVRLKEAALQSGAGDGFEIDFVQMPRLAALLDILHNALGYVAVADALAPMLVAGTPTVHADEVGRTLQARFNAWLSERLGSLDQIRQARLIRAFLASRGPVAPDAIDDEVIVAFWTAQASAAEHGEGFRLYRSAARALLRYRSALRDAMAEAGIEAALPLGTGGGHAEVDLERIAPDALATEAWQSPLLRLATPPADAIKWLTRKEQMQLQNYLGGPRPSGDPDAAAGGDGDSGLGAGLTGDERFDLRFVRTLLRVDVFGAAQSAIVDRLRKRVAAADAVDQVLAPIGEAAYDDCAAAYGAVSEQVQLQSLAALALLIEAGAAETLVLLHHFAGRDAVDAVLAASPGNVTSLHPHERPGAVAGEDDPALAAMFPDGLAALLPAALAAAAGREGHGLPEATRDLLARARGAVRRVNRVGFRREDRADARMLASLRSAVAAVTDLLAELDRLAAALATLDRRAQARADRSLFAAAFGRMYGSP
jgi:hypothetical protein